MVKAKIIFQMFAMHRNLCIHILAYLKQATIMAVAIIVG